MSIARFEKAVKNIWIAIFYFLCFNKNMQSLIVIIIGLLVIGALFYFGPFPEHGQELTPSEKTVSQTQAFLKSAEPSSQSPETKPDISINTYITASPEEGEIINETNEVSFEFRAEVSPKETEGGITFETKIEGLDEDWKKTYSGKRTINFPSGPQEYTFLVRAKIKDFVDQTPAERTFKINTSPYFEKVKISQVRAGSTSRLSLIKLTTYLEKEEEINITGWQIEGRRGDFTIPQGVEKYPSIYSRFSPGLAKDIIIKQSEKIYLSSGSSPLGNDIDFKTNECMGYLTNYYDFPVSISKNCPKPTREEISHLQPCCQEFILDLSRCEIPDFFGNLIVSRDSECVSYLTKNFNYNGCLKNYSQDDDFLEDEWHLFTGRDLVVKECYDTLCLQDQNGLVIDTYQLYGTCK